MTSKIDHEIAARMAGNYLHRLSKIDRHGTAVGALAFLEQAGAGLPDVPLFPEKVRQDAQMWADCADPAELEAYLVAVVAALQDSPLLNKQVKRLAALSFGRMNEQDRQAFLNWSKQQ